MLKIILLFSAGLLCAPASAQTIYKCSEGGKLSYNDRPCKHAVELTVPAAPAAPEAAQRVARERALLKEIEGERAKLEERQARDAAQAQRAAEVQRRRCDKLRLQRKWADEDIAQAGREEAGRARIKARRQGEALALECPV